MPKYLYDYTDEKYVEDEGTDFNSIREFLANQWIDEREDSEYSDMYDKIMATRQWEQLETYADGLGYLICDER